jgi:hypothetical protein
LRMFSCAREGWRKFNPPIGSLVTSFLLSRIIIHQRTPRVSSPGRSLLVFLEDPYPKVLEISELYPIRLSCHHGISAIQGLRVTIKPLIEFVNTTDRPTIGRSSTKGRNSTRKRERGVEARLVANSPPF